MRYLKAGSTKITTLMTRPTRKLSDVSRTWLADERLEYQALVIAEEIVAVLQAKALHRVSGDPAAA